MANAVAVARRIVFGCCEMKDVGKSGGEGGVVSARMARLWMEDTSWSAIERGWCIEGKKLKDVRMILRKKSPVSI